MTNEEWNAMRVELELRLKGAAHALLMHTGANTLELTLIDGRKVRVTNDKFSPFIPIDLKPGEYQMFCGHCGWRCEKNAVCVNECGDCGHRGLLVARG